MSLSDVDRERDGDTEGKRSASGDPKIHPLPNLLSMDWAFASLQRI